MKKCLVLFLLVSVALAGWASGSGGEEKAATEITESQKIQIWYSLGGRYSAPMEEIITKFNEREDLITVEGAYQGGYGTTQEKLVAAYIAGNPPVLSQLEQSLVGFFVENDALVPLEDFIKADKSFDREDFDKNLLKGGTYNNKLYGLPLNVSTPVLYTNRELFREAGLDPDKPPETWEQVYEYSKKMTNPDKKIFGLRMYSSGWIIHSIVKQFGGDLFNKDETKVTFNSKEGKAAFAFLQKMIQEKVCVFQPGKEGSQMDAAGFIAMVPRSTGSIQWFKDNVTHDWGVASFALGKKKAVSLGGGNLYMLKKSTKQQQLAGWKFLQFLTNKENLRFWSISTGYMAARKSAQESPEIQKIWADDPRYTVTYKQLKYSFPRPKVEHWPEIQSMLTEAWTRVMTENVSVDILDDYAKKAQELLD